MRLLVKVLEEKRGTDEENVEAVQRQPRGNFSRVARLVKRRCRPAYMCRSRAYLERGELRNHTSSGIVNRHSLI